jgi:hypothetical protein
VWPGLIPLLLVVAQMQSFQCISVIEAPVLPAKCSLLQLLLFPRARSVEPAPLCRLALALAHA